MAQKISEINGRKVAEDVPAYTDLSRLNGGGKTIIKTVREILFEDGGTTYLCTHSSPLARNCTYTAETVQQVMAHQRSHSDKLHAKKTFENRSNGARKAAATRASNRAARAKSTPPVEIDTQVAATAANMTANAIADGIDEVASQLRGIATQLNFLGRKTRDATPVIDENELDRLREIERNYEALKGLLR